MKTKMTTSSNNNVKKTTKTQQSPNMIQVISLTINKQRLKTRKIMSPMSPRSPKKGVNIPKMEWNKTPTKISVA